MKISDLRDKLRRRLNDQDTQEITVDGYIEDAIHELNYLFPNLDIDSVGELTKDITNMEANIIVIQAQILIELSFKSSSDRDNFKIKKDNISIDNTQQSRDHDSTIENLDKELEKAIFRYSVNTTNWVRVEP